MSETKTRATAVVVNDDPTQLDILAGLLQKSGIVPAAFEGVEAALAAMDPEAPPGLIVTDLYMPGIDGWRFCRLLRSPEYAAFNEVPILVVSATFAGDHPDRIAADLGADAFLPSPVDGKEFTAQARALLAGKDVRRLPRALIVEDGKTLAGLLQKAFAAHGYRADTALSVREAEGAFAGTAYDVAVLDYHLPDGAGDALLDAFRTGRPDCVCLMMTTDPTPELALSWMKRGAAAYLRKPFEPDYLIELCARARRERALLRVEDLLEARTRELRESEERFVLAMEASMDGVWDWDIVTNGVYYSPNYVTMLGYAPGEVSADADFWANRIHPEDREAALRANQDCIEGRSDQFEVEFRMQCKNAEWRWILGRGKAATRDESGRAARIVGTHTDITERKRNEEALRESEEKYRVLIESTSEPIFSVNPDGSYRFVSNAYGKLLNLNPSDIIGKNVKDVFPPDQAEIRLENLRHLFESGKKECRDFTFVYGDGKEQLVQVTMEPFYDEQGKPLWAIGIYTDITERKRAEEAMRHTEQRLRLANRATNDVIWDWDIIADLQQWNESGTIVFGWTEIVENPVNADWWVQRVHPDDRQRVHDTFFGVVNNPLSDAWHDEYRFLKTDGSYADVLDRGYVLRDEQGKAIRMVGAMLDITERKRAEEGLREKEAAMRAILDATTEALSVIDVEGTLLMINTAFANRFNKTSEDLIGTSIYDLIAPELAKSRREQVDLVLRSSKPIQFEDQRGDRFVEHSLYPIFDGVGNVNRIAIFARDITERKQADKELRESEERFRVLSEAAFEAIAIHEEGVLHNANEQYFKMFGYEPGEALGRQMMSMTVAPEAMELTKKQIAKDALGSYESIGIRKDGTRFPIEIRARKMVYKGRHVRFAAISDITERKQAEKDLRESEERYRNIFDNSIEGIYQTTIEGRYRTVNPSFAAMFGYESPAEMICAVTNIGEQLYVNQEDRKKLVARMETSGGMVKDYQVQLRRKDGSLFWVSINACIVMDEQQGRSYIEGTCMDITERKQSEEKLRKSEERFRNYIENAPEGIFIADEKGNYIFVNNAACKTTEYSREELLEKNLIELIYNEDIQKAGDHFRRIQETGSAEGELRFVTKGGNVRWWVVKAVQLSPVQFFGFTSDITERKRAEEKLQSYQRRLSDIVEFLPDATLVIDMEGKVIAWNRAIVEMTGIKAEEMLGRGDYEYSLPFYGERRPILVDLALRDDREREKQYTAFRRDGDIVFGEAYTPRLSPGHVHLSATASVLRNSAGDIVGAIQCIRNNTERKIMEDRLKRAEKMESLGLLAGGVAHDLNNALGILVGYSELLYNDLDESDPHREDARNIITGGEQAAAIVQDMLTLARRGVQTRAVVDLNKIITEYFKSPEFLKLTSFHPDIRIKTEPDEYLLKISGSRVHLSKSLMNLVSNAVEAMTSGGEIVIRTENRYLDRPVSGYDELREGDYVVLTVSDEGEGITDDDMKRIFEPFYTKKVMGRSGTGLGLSVVWGTVKDHDGYIDLQSRRGRGTTFTLYFPVTRDEIQEDKTAHVDEYMGRDEKVLVVDDVQSQRDLASRILIKLNYRVEVLASGEAAVEYLKSNEADLVVLDMIMEPGIDGFETYRRILEIRPNQKAIIVSGFAETERVKMAQSLGAGVFVKKPYIQERIGLAVRKELDRK